MLNPRNLFIAILASLFCLPSFAAKRKGGPVPVPDSTQVVVEDLNILPHLAEAKDFIFLWQKNALLYRDKSNQLNWLSLHGSERRHIGRATRALAESSDSGNFVFFAYSNRILDTNTLEIFAAKGIAAGSVPQFWHQEALYYTQLKGTLAAPTHIEIYRYSPKHHKTNKVCRLALPSGSVRIAKGSQFPHIYLYEKKKHNHETFLISYRLNLDRCQMAQENKFGRVPVYGDLKSVYRFSPFDGLAVTTNHPTHKLFWKTPSNAKFIEIDSNFRFPSSRLPFAITKEKQGLALIDIPKLKKHTIYPGSVEFSLNLSEVYLSPNGKHLLVNFHFFSGQRPYHFRLEERALSVVLEK